MIEKITSRQNAQVRRMKKLGTSSRFRADEGVFVCDGKKLLEEARLSGAAIESVFVQDESEIAVSEFTGCTYIVPREIMEYMSALKTPQGVMFTCKIPKPRETVGTRLILLDHLQDAGNIGTIIRAADAFGIDGLVLDGCADPYNPKTVRAAMGSLFRVPLFSGELVQVIPKLKAANARVYAAVLSDSACDIRTVNLLKASVVIGNEGAGVCHDVAALCEHIILPMAGRAESLNASVAAGIIMWEMQKR
ncbi:MAG: RNA methyltransferase [Clostridia bacterium]